MVSEQFPTEDAIDADTPDIAGIKRRKLAGVDGAGRGMIGMCARRLEPRHVCKIRKFTRRFECGDEAANSSP